MTVNDFLDTVRYRQFHTVSTTPDDGDTHRDIFIISFCDGSCQIVQRLLHEARDGQPTGAPRLGQRVVRAGQLPPDRLGESGKAAPGIVGRHRSLAPL